MKKVDACTKQKKIGRDEIDNLINNAEISKEKYEKMDIDEPDELNDVSNINNNKYINNKGTLKKEELDSNNKDLSLLNLNEKYEFEIGIINYNDIIFRKNKNKICYKKIDYFKSSKDYNNYRYFTFKNYNKKSKINRGIKMCNGKIKNNFIEKEAELTILHTNE